MNKSANTNTHDRSRRPVVSTQELNPDGRAIFYMRFARPRSEEAIAVAVDRIASHAAAHGVEPRLLITATGGGIRHFNECDDLLLLIEHASADWCEWIVTTRYDRISRSMPVMATFLDRIGEHNTRLVAIDNGDTFNTDAEAQERAQERLLILRNVLAVERLDSQMRERRIAAGKKRRAGRSTT